MRDPPISRLLNHARKCLDQAEATQSQRAAITLSKYFRRRKGTEIDPKTKFVEEWTELGLPGQLSRHLTEARDALEMALEMGGLDHAHGRFLKEWAEASDDSGRQRVLKDFIKPLEAAFGTESPAVAVGLETLHYLLTCTARILWQHEIVPRREADIQSVMRVHLANAFSDFVPNPRIAKPLKTFNPDGGVLGLSAAIEFKFANSEEKLAVAVAGISEDLSGYAGSQDWTRFYSVLYQTGPFTTETQFEKALGLSGNAGKWKMIVVTSGDPKPNPTVERSRSNSRAKAVRSPQG